MALIELGDAAVLGGRDQRRREQAENFPVALRVLPRRLRRDLQAVYGVARFVDDIGDDPHAAPQQRLQRLDAVEADLRRAFAGDAATLAAVRRLQPAIAAGRLRLAPFLDLLAANRVDQEVRRYPTYADLRGYCARSADPVGRIVLAVFGVDDEDARLLSDQVCTALQILEHCQDVVEDKRDRDRVYLPGEDLARFGVADDDLVAATASAGLRRVVATQVDRASLLLEGGSALAHRLRGFARLAITGFVAGGLATVDALRRCDYDVCATAATPRRRDIARHALRLLAGRR